MIALTVDRTTISLPNPHWNDSENLIHDLNIQRTLGGNIYTYIHSKSRRRLIMNIRLSFAKSKELRLFLQAYASKKVVLIDHLSQRWFGNIMNNPFELEGLKNDDQEIQLIFEGVKA